MLATLVRSARARTTIAAVTAVAAIGLAVPASAGLLAPDEPPDTPAAGPTATPGLDALLDRLAGSCETATKVPARLLSVPVDLSACDLRGTLVRAGALAVRVPRQAHTGAAAASLVTKQAPDNAVTKLSVVNTGREIVVDVLRVGDAPHGVRPGGSDEVHAAARDACSTRAHAYIGTRNDVLRWSFNRGTTPSYLSGSVAESAITEGAHIMSSGRNNCGLAELDGIAQSYQGATSQRFNCQSPDGHNVIDFGPRPKSTLATTCWWYSTRTGVRQVLEVDLRFQDNRGTFYYREPANCQKRFQLTGVAVHEFGHAFGLAHVNEKRYPQLTMSPAAPVCSPAQASLGRGDWLGLRHLYGE